MMYRTDDPYADFQNHEREQELVASKLPECDYCGSTIDDHYFNINGEILCEDCLNENFRMVVEVW